MSFGSRVQCDGLVTGSVRAKHLSANLYGCIGFGNGEGGELRNSRNHIVVCEVAVSHIAVSVILGR